jgi:uncharacterized protein (DUF342 family)
MRSPPQPNNKVEGEDAPRVNLDAIKKHFRKAIDKIEYEDKQGSFNNIIIYAGNNTKVVFYKKTKDLQEINLETIINDLNDIRELFRTQLLSSNEEIEEEIRTQFFENASEAKFTCGSIQMTCKSGDSLNQTQRHLSNLAGQLDKVSSNIDKLQDNKEEIDNWFDLIQDD